MREKKWLIELPENSNPYSLKKWFELQINAVKAKLIFNSLRELLETMNIHKLTLQEFHETIRNVVAIISKVPKYRTNWLHYLTPYQIQLLTIKPELEKEFVQSLHTDFDKLCEFDRLKESMLSYETMVLTKLRDEIGGWKPDMIEGLFQNSIRLAWIEHIEMKYPILRAVSTFKMDEMQTELQQRVSEKKELSIEILLMRARERVYEGIEYNRFKQSCYVSRPSPPGNKKEKDMAAPKTDLGIS